VRLIDFGICFFLARFKEQRNLRSVGEGDFDTGPMEVAGSAGYTDPAILSGEYSPSVQSDIFSVCVVLYEMLTGRRLYDEKALAFRAIDSGEVAPELATAVLEIRRGSQFSPKDRHVSMDELIRGLEIARSTVLRAQTRPARSATRGLLLGLGVANLLGLVALAVFWTEERIEARPAVEVVAAFEPPAAASPAPVEIAGVVGSTGVVEAAEVFGSTGVVEAAEVVGSTGVVEAAEVVEPPVTVGAAAVVRRAGKTEPAATRSGSNKSDDTRLLSQALVSELAAGQRDALRGCAGPGDTDVELMVEAGHVQLVSVEWERYDAENAIHGCIRRVLLSLGLPRNGPAGPYHLTIRN
jgi:hypothetical protein